jgi:hypothetical protein
MSIRWIARVWETSPYRGERLLLHLALADFANDEGVCWPSQPTLARKARVSVEFIRQSLKQMIVDDLLDVERVGGGRGITGIYRLKPPPAKVVSSTTKNPNDDSATPLTNRNEPSTRDDEFETWWQAYPRKVGKAGARREWRALAARLPPLDDLLDRTRRYADSLNDIAYCVYPAKWLADERWTDDLPAAPATVEAAGIERQALNLAAGFINTNRTEQDLVDALTHLPPAAQQLALQYYRARRPQ